MISSKLALCSQIVRPGRYAAVLLAGMFLMFLAVRVNAQGVDFENRPVAEIRVEGLQQVPEQLIRNQIRISVGDPYDSRLVQEDVVRITHLGRFQSVEVRVEQTESGTVIVTYVMDEQPLISDVRVVGNKNISDNELLSLMVLRSGDPVDPYLIDRGLAAIKREYESKGYFVTDVTIDGDLLKESGVVLVRVREGPKIRIRGIAFEGNTVFSGKELKSQLQSKTYIFLLRGGEMSREMLDSDADRLRNYYHDRGYIDAQVGRRIDVAPNQRDATVVFFVEEGGRYIVDTLKIEGNEVYSDEQLKEVMELQIGDVFSDNRLKKSTETLTAYYGKIGYIHTRILIERQRHLTEPKVDVVVGVTEGKAYEVGRIAIRGNDITRDRVITRQIRGLEPGKPFDGTGIKKTADRLKATQWFEDAKITILGEREDDVRDVLIEVQEKNTGSLSFGAGISSDAGVVGAVELTQRNFDITDTPESAGEFFSGKAFRGAGQYFSLAISPGDEVSNYSISFRDPYFLDTAYFFDSSLFFFERERDDYDEQRVGANFGFGKAFGDIWQASVSTRVENIDISSIDIDAPDDVFAVEGTSTLTALTFGIARSTVDSRIFPTRGSRLNISLSQVGALGGDFDYTSFVVNFKKFWTVDEDFLGRRTVFSARTQFGYLFPHDDAPIFERFNAGGHRTFRGFDFRGIGPRQNFDNILGNPVDNDESLGGDFLFLLSFEYNVPIYKEIVRMVFFVDSGTVEDDFEITTYRVAVGAGLRLNIPFLGQAPFAFDLAFPIVKAGDDETRVFSFDIALPF